MSEVRLPDSAFESHDFHEIMTGVPGPVIRSKKFPLKCLECPVSGEFILNSVVQGTKKRTVFPGVMAHKGSFILCTRCVLCGDERRWGSR
jgi:hypothetical protein